MDPGDGRYRGKSASSFSRRAVSGVEAIAVESGRDIGAAQAIHQNVEVVFVHVAVMIDVGVIAVRAICFTPTPVIQP